MTYGEYHVKQQVLSELEQDGFPLSRLQQGNLVVLTTLDRAAQSAARSALVGRLKSEPKEFRGALVSVNPAPGAVRAYDGGENGVRDYAGTGHARVGVLPVDARGWDPGRGVAGPAGAGAGADRLPGRGLLVPGSMPVEVHAADGHDVGADTPYLGLAKRLGPDAVSAAARDAGIPADVDGTPTLREKDGYLIGSGIAVGRYPSRPLDVVGAYATFADHEVKVAPHLVDKVLDREGNVVWEHDSDPQPAFPRTRGRVRRWLRG
ncbi:hypothetical protein [Amycolatopsis sp. FDAARGOS 1241]|uniref:hypothetical protein n=1 Tax=Amycolatopsis sp. FDAARGOS 1241 TaxID=2778070 RepID=UPI00351C58F1